jgi:LacI family transcriptional regulator of maltose regulon
MRQRFETLISQGVDGVIIAGAIDKGSELRDRAAEVGMPLFASRASYLDDIDLIRPDNMQAAQIVTEHLIRRGHQRIAWLGGQSVVDAGGAGGRILRDAAEVRSAVS